MIKKLETAWLSTVDVTPMGHKTASSTTDGNNKTNNDIHGARRYNLMQINH